MKDNCYGAPYEVWEHFRYHAPMRDLLPVVSNPNAAISGYSKMGGIGKTPSRYNTQKRVCGFPNWTSHETQQFEIRKWRNIPDFGICIQTRHIRAIDVDISCPEQAAAVAKVIDFHLGWMFDLPTRSRPNSSKFLVAFIVDGELTKRRMLTNTLDDKGRNNAIEFLANGQQFVAYGTHPSGVKYSWGESLPTEFPVVDIATFETLWADLVDKFAVEAHVDAPSVKVSKKRTAADMDDDMVDYLDEFWEVKGADQSGRVDIRCPWEHEHSTESGDSATSYFPAGVGGFDKGHFRCLHTHCAGRTEIDWLNAIGYSTYDFEVIPDDAPSTAQVQTATANEIFKGSDTTLVCPDGKVIDLSDFYGDAKPDKPLTDSEKRKAEFANAKGIAVKIVSSITPAKNQCTKVPHGINMFRNAASKGNYAGCIEPNRVSVIAALSDPTICGVRMGYDTFRDEIMIGNLTGTQWASFTDKDYTALALSLENGDNGMVRFEPIPLSLIKECVKYVVMEHRFDSLKLLGLSFRGKWDGVKRVEKFLPTYFKAADSEYTRAVSKYLWTAILGRMLVPGIKADMVAIAVGVQGARKTSLVRAMAYDQTMFVELDLHKGENDLAREMRGKSIAELGEMKGLGAKQNESVKAFISRGTETWIPKYQEFATRYDRRCIFVGTSNDDETLPDDPTGHRRWLPFHLEDAQFCDTDAINRDKEQIYAEALEMFIEHGVMWQDAERLAKAEHATFEKCDPWETVLRDYLFDATLEGHAPTDAPISLNAVILGARLANSVADISLPMAHRVGKCLRKIGMVRVRRGTTKMWVMGEAKAAF